MKPKTSSIIQVVLTIVVINLAQVLCYPTYKDKIPNGQIVRNPFDTDGGNPVWRGVGHWSLEGGGARNPFGVAFAANNKVWDSKLCNEDSDQDGVSNGVELCDPSCSWREGQPAPTCNSPQLPSHPGICEPVTDAKCKPLNIAAKVDNFECPDKTASGVQSTTLKLGTTTIPTKETTYFCKLFELPHDKPYHIVASEPQIESDYIHHVDVYGCTQNELNAKNGWVWNTFQNGSDCEGLASMYCGYLIAGWTVGYGGMCTNGGPFGFLIGGSDYQYALIEYHWDNKGRQSGLTDSSGMTLYYTDQLRANNLGTMQVGQIFLNIPPNVVKHSEHAVCTKECTSRPKMAEESCLKLISVNIHMHLLGDSGSITIKKPTGSEIIAVDATYDYNTPVEHTFEQYKLICPGDEVIVECNYTTKGTNRQQYVHYGEGAYEEMCIGYLTYYPNKFEAPYCTQLGKVNFCETDEDIIHGTTERGCNLETFMEGDLFYNTVQEINKAAECQGTSCSQKCLEYLKCTLYSKHNCLKHNDIRYTMILTLEEETDANYRAAGSKMAQCYNIDPSDSLSCDSSSAADRYISKRILLLVCFVWLFFNIKWN